jgi:lipopolysaccharide transport system ATP-binding protein
VNDVVITAEGLGKRYRLRHGVPATTLSESTTALASTLARRRRPPKSDFWALRDVSFEVRRGEVLGVIGANGAGKSTLLKLLARITEPTEGVGTVKGRVGSLLEVGTGFHPELTGRDNVFLNGAILGMKRAEIARKFDEIVEFSGVHAFIDVPVKRYSSGMQVRLAFAVAAFLEPEILLVDEVLSVGDMAFREKSLQRIHEVTRAGRTVLFVSHNLASLERLCSRGIFLESGGIVLDGPVSDAVKAYVDRNSRLTSGGDLAGVHRTGTGAVRFTSVEITSASETTAIRSGQRVDFRLGLASAKPFAGSELTFAIGIDSRLGNRLMTMVTAWDPDSGVRDGVIADGSVVSCAIPSLPLAPGRYLVTLYAAHASDVLDLIEGQVELDVLEADFFETGTLPTETQGPFLVRHHWELVTEPSMAAPAR